MLKFFPVNNMFTFHTLPLLMENYAFTEGKLITKKITILIDFYILNLGPVFN